MGLRAVFILMMFAGGGFAALRNPVTGVLIFGGMTYIRPERLSYGQLLPFRLFMVMSGIVLASYIINKDKLEFIPNQSKAFICLAFLAFLQVIFTPFAVYSVEISWKYATDFAKIVIFCYLMIKILTTEDRVKWFLGVNILGVMFIATWGFQQHFLGNERLSKVAGGNYDDCNSIGTLFAQFAPIMLAIVFMIKRKIYKIVPILFLGILVADVLFTQSRSALLGMIIGIALFFLYMPPKAKIVLLVFFILLMPLIKTTVFSIDGFVERIESTTSGEDKGADRISIWKAGQQIFYDHLITGVGQQNFKFLAKEYCLEMGLEHSFSRLADPHNQFLLTAAETGIMGIIALLFAILFQYYDLYYLKKRWKKDERYKSYIPLLIGLQCGMTAFLISAMFHTYPINENFYWFLIYPGLIRNAYVARLRTRNELI